MKNIQQTRPQFRPGWWLLAAACLLLVAFAAAAQEPAEPEAAPEQEAPKDPVPVRARIVTTPSKTLVTTPPAESLPGNRHVRGIRVLRRGGGRVDWSQQGDWIAYDEANSQGVYDLYVMNAVSGSERCLTCDQYDLRKIHSLSPVWHPSGDYLVFQVQDRPRRVRLDTLDLATPHRGLHGDLWAISRDGKDIWQLTQIAANGGAVIDPHFSHEADRLVWSERLENYRGRWGYWSLRVAGFEIKRGLPRLGKVRTFRPQTPPGFVVANGFTPDDRGLLLSAEAGGDILRLDMESGTSEHLTATPDHRDELVSTAPRSDRLVWVSDRGIARRRGQRLPYRGDLWFMSESERTQERLTFFNHPKSDHTLGEALIDDLAWSPQGDRLVLHVVYPAGGRGALEDPDLVTEDGEPIVEEAIYLVELDESFTSG